ncbi:MAG: plasmid stabilization protein [Acidobacteriota bacterium]|nr:plasmid stabilization protein [Acidobacteriota bacterium]
MATLTIRNIDEETKEKLKVISKASGRSVESQVRMLIAYAVEHPWEMTPVKSTEGFGSSLAALFDGDGDRLKIPARDEYPDEHLKKVDFA